MTRRLRRNTTGKLWKAWTLRGTLLLAHFVKGLLSCILNSNSFGLFPLRRRRLIPGKDDGSKKTLILDLDETLIHSSFEPVCKYDFSLEMFLCQQHCKVYVTKRPGLEEFLNSIKEKFEIVVFTASLKEYADPILDLIDPNNIIHHRLYRDSCHVVRKLHVKDLNWLGRDVNKCVIVDNSPVSYLLHPQNAIPIRSFMGDCTDSELNSLSEILTEMANSPLTVPSTLALMKNP
ncbi:NLI interacting factor [Pelomyxa schiedti]|nr:NLI interacting factor [Pelomyxa schiedti]